MARRRGAYYLHVDGRKVEPEHVKILRAMPGERRLEMAEQLYWMARELKLAGVRSDHPEWTEEQVIAEVNRIFLNARS